VLKPQEIVCLRFIVTQTGAARRTPTPKHFDAQWKLPRSFLSDTVVLTEIADPGTPPLDANAALEELRTLSNSVLDEYQALIVSYPHPTQMKS
jgi:hypothetical protein